MKYNSNNVISVTMKLTLIWFLLFLNGCQSASQGGKYASTYDKQLVAVAKEVPGFGGMHFDYFTNSFTVYLKGENWQLSLTQPTVVEDMLRAEFVGIFGIDMSAGESMVFVAGQYDTIQLNEWNTKAASLQISGVLSTDLDAKRNRVAIEILDESVRLEVESALTAQNIPVDAIIIEVTPTIPDNTLLSYDDQLVLVAKEVAGFGGLFNASGAFNVYLSGESWKLSLTQPLVMEGMLRTAFIKIFGSDMSNGQSMVFLKGQYDAIQLFEWKNKTSLLILVGAVAIDLDEAQNRIWIGISDESVRIKAQAILIMNEVPLEAVIFEITGGATVL